MGRFTSPTYQALSRIGTPLPGAKLFIFDTGTTDKKSLFLDSDQTIPTANPVIANGAGFFPLFFFSGTTRQRLESNRGTLIWERDPVAELQDAIDTPTGLTEQVQLLSGQTTVVFAEINASNSVFYICGENADNGRLCTPQDYTITNDTTIELAESYPADTVILGDETEASVEGGTSLSKQRETVVLTAGQTIVVFGTLTGIDQADIYICDDDVGRGILCPGTDYTVDSAVQITLTNSYPDQTTLLAVKEVL